MPEAQLQDGSRELADGAPAGQGHRPGRRFGGFGMARFSGLYLWAGFIIIYAVWVPATFLTGTTAKSIAADEAVTGVLALSALFPLAAGAYDLSIAQNLGFSALVCGALMTWSHVPVVLAIVITLAGGAGIGMINGFLVAIVGVNSFIATLGMTSVLLAVGEALANGLYVGPFPSGFQKITQHSLVGIPTITIYLVVLALIAWYALEHTPIGRRTYATGANPEAARLAGVRTTTFTFWTFVVCGLGSSLAGILLASQVGTVDQTIGPAYLLPAFAACFLGTTQLKPGRFNVWGTVVALYLLATGVKGLQLAGGQLWITDMFNGIALIGAVSVAVLSEKGRLAREKRRPGAASGRARWRLGR